jgi:protein-S-isoprenylcysteine O-methyltransferase Ste14
LLVVPWVGFLANSWLGSVIGVVLYVGTRIYSPLEDEILLKNFGTSWEEYRYKIKIPWL